MADDLQHKIDHSFRELELSIQQVANAQNKAALRTALATSEHCFKVWSHYIKQRFDDTSIRDF